MGIQENLANRDTPAGRAFESKVIFFDCLTLVLGCAGLALSFPPLLYVAAVGHIISNFFQAPVKWLWPAFEAMTVGIATVLFLGALYLVQVYYYQFPSAGVVGYLTNNWPQHLAAAIVASGVIGNLLALPGVADQLRELKNLKGNE